MLHNILLTGASGYLGGSLLARLAAADLPPYDKLYALIRSKNQAQAVRQCSNATPLTCDVKDEAAIHETIIGNEITVVLFLIDASSSVSQTHMIKALADVKAKTGKDVHFIHVRVPLRLWRALASSTSTIGMLSDASIEDKWSKALFEPCRSAYGSGAVRR